MKRWFFLVVICLIALTLFTAVLNMPRVAEARAHEAAANAMQTQAIVTGLAVVGILLLVGLLALFLLLVVGFLLWGMVTGRLAMIGRFTTRPSGKRRMQFQQSPQAPHPQAPHLQASHPNLLVPHYHLPTTSDEPDWQNNFDWHTWENTPWEIDEPF